MSELSPELTPELNPWSVRLSQYVPRELAGSTMPWVRGPGEELPPAPLILIECECCGRMWPLDESEDAWRCCRVPAWDESGR